MVSSHLSSLTKLRRQPKRKESLSSKKFTNGSGPAGSYGTEAQKHLTSKGKLKNFQNQSARTSKVASSQSHTVVHSHKTKGTKDTKTSSKVSNGTLRQTVKLSREKLKSRAVKLHDAPLPVPQYEPCWFCDGVGMEYIEKAQGSKIVTVPIMCSKCDGTGRLVKYHHPRVNKKTSVQLHKYTKLSPGQLLRLEQSGGNGARAKFSANGEVSLELIRRVELAKRKGPKYLLYTDELGRRTYIADRDLDQSIKREDLPLTFEIKKALKFYEEFDNDEIKKKYYHGLTKLNFRTIPLSHPAPHA